MWRHGNQTLINIMQMKIKPIAFNSPRLMLKLIRDQDSEYNDKKFGLFVRKLSFSWSKNGFLSFVIRELLAFECVVSNQSPWAINQKILLGPNRVNGGEKFDVLRGRLLGNHNNFHWQLGGQINHQPCSCKAARFIRSTELDSAVSSF